MQLAFSFEGLVYSREGYPRITLIIYLPKLGNQKLESKKVAIIRNDLLIILRAISDEAKANPESFAIQIFKTIKSEYQNITLGAVIFTIRHENEGDTVLTFSKNDIDLVK